MSTRYNNGSHYENHQRAAELHDGAAHAHRVAAQHGQQDYLTGHERSRQALEHSRNSFLHSQTASSFGHDEIAELAYDLWRARGCPEGSPDEDWLHAVEKLRSAVNAR
jgi:hypothetical protein